MNALTFDIALKEPLIISNLGAGEENSAVSFDYIPGGTIRGMLINEYKKQNNIVDEAVDKSFRRLFLDGSVCFLNAYIKSEDYRALPKPNSWLVKKDDVDKEKDIDIFDFAVDAKDQMEDYRPSLGNYICHDDKNGKNVSILTPKMGLMVHNVSFCRNVKEEGKSNVYRYESLSADQVFSGAIISDDINDLKRIEDLLNKKLFKIGASRSAGYGLIKIDNIQRQTDWDEYNDNGDVSEDYLTISLLSDAIIIDSQGQNTLDNESLFNTPVEKAYCEPKIIGGFDRKWGLPLPQEWAFKAGSVFVYKKDNVIMEDLKKRVQTGIGQRRAEGFGRIAVNWHGQETYKGIKPDSDKKHQQDTTILLKNRESIETAKVLVERMWRNLLDKKLADAVADFNISFTSETSKTQLSKLRNIVHDMWYKKDHSVLDKYKAYLKNAKTAKKQLENVKISSKKVKLKFENIFDLLCNNYCEKTWDQYFKFDEEQEPHLAGVVLSDDIINGLKIEYAARMLDGALKNALEEGENQ